MDGYRVTQQFIVHRGHGIAQIRGHNRRFRVAYAVQQVINGIGFDGLDRSIDARISRLRKKLNDDPDNPTRIKTVRGKGYLFSKHDWN